MNGIFAHWPNRITALRFVGACVLFAILSIFGNVSLEESKTIPWELSVAFWLFVITAATDYLDGYLARRDNLITAFGRIADPFVDKILVTGTLVFLAVMPWSRHWFPAWIVVVILAREFLVTAIRGYVESIGREFPADMFGKVKLVVQCFAIGIPLGVRGIDWGETLTAFWEFMAYFTVYATLVTSLGSGISYIFKTRDILTAEEG